MPFLTVNRVRLAYERAGSGRPVLLICGSDARKSVWTLHQTPALRRAGYETVIFDNRGVAPSSAPPGRYRLEELVLDTAELIEGLGLGPCSVVGTSLGATIAQELAALRPELVRCAVLIGTRPRADAVRRALTAGERELTDKNIVLPLAYRAAVWAQQMLSPATLADDAAVTNWLELFELTGGSADAAGGQAWIDLEADRTATLRAVRAPCRVIAYTDDLLSPPHLGREVAATLPDCDYRQIDGCGHLGYLERPEETNAAILEFLGRH